ncbi:hypothetical protein FQN54_003420 [Arachnomyces sp. PD_36]|nr:hypothetical protein FQN54_003420 [Arachnomyces sp. PD_36]
MVKIATFLFSTLLLPLGGVLADPVACPEGEEPIKVIEPAPQPTGPLPNNNVPPPLSLQGPPEEDSAPEELEEEPPAEPPTSSPSSSPEFTITTDQILQIAPNSKSCDTATPKFADECRTADVAAKYISESFERYGISSRVEQAAVLGWMAMESGEFRFSRNHFPRPGRPGQGTYNIQSLAFNIKYIDATPELKSNLSTPVDISSSICGPDACVIPATIANAALDMILQNDQYAFATGAWFMKDICSEEVKSALADDMEAGWEQFVTKCVYAPLSEIRREYWEKAKAALGLAGEAPVAAPVETAGPVPGEGSPAVSVVDITRTAVVGSAPTPAVLRQEATEDTAGKSLEPRNLPTFLDVMFGNRLDTICTEPKSNPTTERQRVDMSASVQTFIHTIANCSEGKESDSDICKDLPSSFSNKPTPPRDGLNTTLTYHEAYLSTLWLNLHALRPTNMLAPSTDKVFNNTTTNTGSPKTDNKPSSKAAPVLNPSDLTQCTYLSSLQELAPSSPVINAALSKKAVHHHRRHSARKQHNHAQARQMFTTEGRVAVIIRWVDDTCAAGTQEELYSKDDMVRWCDEVGKAVRVEGGAGRAVGTFEGWVGVI